MDYRNDSSGGWGNQGVNGMPRKREPEAVSLEAFITSNWQILTIFGVFAGITNYMSGMENNWLVTLGFLLTFIVELEILLILLKTKNKSFLLKLFTILSAVFILIFAGFIYSNHLSSIFSGFEFMIYPIVNANRILLVRTIFLVSSMIIFLGLYRHLRSVFTLVLGVFANADRKLLALLLATLMFLTIAIGAYVWIGRADVDVTPTQTSTTLAQIELCTPPMTLVGGECCLDSDGDGTCDYGYYEPTTTSTASTSSTSSTASTIHVIACLTNRDCGNQTENRICYKGDVYIQQGTPLCQKPGTTEARCIYKTILLGETITQEANPYERCSRGCKDGECIE
ncbi:MAG: hypothetical protein ABIH11_08515 [Candidatus Altiarchaeota archaeon]